MLRNPMTNSILGDEAIRTNQTEKKKRRKKLASLRTTSLAHTGILLHIPAVPRNQYFIELR